MIAHFSCLLLPISLCFAVDSTATYTIDLATEFQNHVYDGHGALSAGASSRLLIDYPEQQRNDILDLLFKPNFGAALDLIKTGYYSQDEIDYHVKWLECTKKYQIGTINYMGNWNERPWGTVEWTKQYKKAMEAAGFNSKIIIPDGGGGQDILKDCASDKEFDDAVAGIGLHYPCQNKPEGAQAFLQGKKFWSSEDYSTVGNWAGAACWGRILNQNFIRMNMTSTISWSLIWSVYGSGFPYF
eukprot:UC4_evm1s13